ncbi:potassium channel family protein [Streptomyces sp. NPDC051322]|uniref:potassium channel family protein n=1 Tax=Streptomyces sp. NPDC051322 TaxID=3154645 RepID=UPI00344B07BA
MLPGFLIKAINLLLDREGRSLHSRTAAWATGVLIATMLVGSWAVVIAERGTAGATLTSYPRAVWWSVETATTVGYGDFYPLTAWGRIIAAVMMVVGITTYGMVTAALATWFVARENARRHRLAEAADHTHHVCEVAAQVLHERFDRMERLLAEADGKPRG